MIDRGVSVSSGEQRGTHGWGPTSRRGGQGQDSTRRILGPLGTGGLRDETMVTDRAARLPVSV